MQSLQYKMSYQQSLVTFTSRQSARENAELFSRKQIRTTGGKIFSYSLVWHHNDYIEKSDRQTQWPWPVFLELLKRKQIFSGSISKYWQEQRWFLELLGVRDDFGVGIDFKHDIDNQPSLSFSLVGVANNPNIKAIIDKFDGNGDGKLTFDDFVRQVKFTGW